jgi:hypothetical protein
MHEWAKSLHSINSSQVGTNGITIDSNNNSYVIGSYSIGGFVVDSDTLYSNSHHNNGNSYIAKFDQSGKLEWIRGLFMRNNSRSGNTVLSLLDIKTITDNKILIVGRFTTNSNHRLILNQTDSINQSYGGQTAFYVIYDSLGNITKFGKVFEGGFTSFPANQQILTIDNQKNIYYTCRTNAAGFFHSD